jgi:hypothetical protein
VARCEAREPDNVQIQSSTSCSFDWVMASFLQMVGHVAMRSEIYATIHECRGWRSEPFRLQFQTVVVLPPAPPACLYQLALGLLRLG